MNLQIGTTIKNLRTKRKVTQDQLATFLGVTPQAVSRWESDTAYPDIELLPSIADYFSVSTDDLLGVNKSEREKNLKAIHSEIKRLSEVGSLKERIEYARQAVAQYPSELDLQENLAICLSFFDDEPDLTMAKEAESIYTTILDSNPTESMRYDVLSNLCYLYSRCFKDSQKALAAADKLPQIKYCREFQKASGVGDGKTEYYIQEEIDVLTDALGTSFRDLVLNEDLPNTPETWDKKIKMMQTSNDLYLMIYGNNLMFYHERLAFNYWIISTYQISQGKTNEALESLEKSCKHAVSYDESFKNDHGKYYTSPFIDKIVYPEPNGNFHELAEHSQCYYLLDRLQNKRYDILRADPHFIQIVKQLNAYSK